MDAKTFGARISTRRHELGLTQAALARKVGVTDKAVSKWERGAGLPDVELLEPLASALGLSVDELIRGEGAVPQNVQTAGSPAQIEKTELRVIAPTPACGMVSDCSIPTLESAGSELGRDEPEPKRRGGIPSVRAKLVLPAIAAVVLVAAVFVAAQQLGDGRIVASASADGGSTSVEQSSYAPTTAAVDRAAIEASQIAANKDRAELQLARDQQEWRMANRAWSSDDLQWDAVTNEAITTIAAELKVQEACAALGNGAFKPDFVSGMQALRLEDGGETLRVEASGTYGDGTTGTCSALVGGDCENPVVQELSVVRS